MAGSTLWHFKHRTAGVDTIKTLCWSLKFPQGKSGHTKWQENLYRVPNMGYTPRRRRKKKHANMTMTGSPCNEWNPLCSNGTGRNSDIQVCNGQKLDGCVKTENQIPFHCLILVMLPRFGSFVNLFYDDRLGKIFMDSLISLETGEFAFHYWWYFIFAMALGINALSFILSPVHPMWILSHAHA